MLVLRGLGVLHCRIQHKAQSKLRGNFWSANSQIHQRAPHRSCMNKWQMNALAYILVILNTTTNPSHLQKKYDTASHSLVHEDEGDQR